MRDFTVIYWRDIPTQIVSGKGRRSKKLPLADRFMVAVDKAAMNAGATDANAYLEDWRKVPLNADDGQNLEQLAADLEQRYPATRLAALARNCGHEPDSDLPSTKKHNPPEPLTR